MSKKQQSPFGCATTGQVRSLRNTVEIHLSWRNRYLQGCAGDFVPFAALLRIGPDLGPVTKRAVNKMEERTERWLAKRDTPELREANLLHDLRQVDPAAYEIRIPHQQLPAADD